MIVQANSSKTLYDILCKLTDITPSNPALLNTALIKFFEEQELNSNFGYAFAALVKAFEDVRKDIENCEQISSESKRIYLRTLSTLEQIVNLENFNTSWSAAKQNYLRPQTIEQLYPISDFLAQHCPQKRISPDEITGIREDCEKLRNTVEEKESMHEELRQILLHQLNEIINAISLYNTFGDTAFKQKAKELFGDIFTNPIILSETEEPEKRDLKSIVKRMYNAVKETHDIVDKSLKIAENADKLSLFFGG